MRIFLSFALLLVVLSGCAATPHQSMRSSIAGPVTLAMDLSSGRPAIMASYAGQAPALVTFDSGGQSAIIPRSIADRLGLEVIGEVMIGSPGGQPSKAFIVSLGKLVIGGIESPNPTAVVLDDSQFPPNDLRLIIGPAQLANRVVMMNFAQRSMLLGDLAPKNAMEWQPLDARGLLHGQLEIDGQTLGVHIDTGKPRALSLPMKLADQLTKGQPLIRLPDAKLVDRALPRFLGRMNSSASLPGLKFTVDAAEFIGMPEANLGTAALVQLAALVVIDGPGKRWAISSTKPGALHLTEQAEPTAR